MHGGMRTQGEDAICKPRRETSGGTSPANTLIRDFQPPELWDNMTLLFKPCVCCILLWQRGQAHILTVLCLAMGIKFLLLNYLVFSYYFYYSRSKRKWNIFNPMCLSKARRYETPGGHVSLARCWLFHVTCLVPGQHLTLQTLMSAFYCSAKGVSRKMSAFYLSLLGFLMSWVNWCWFHRWGLLCNWWDTHSFEISVPTEKKVKNASTAPCSWTWVSSAFRWNILFFVLSRNQGDETIQSRLRPSEMPPASLFQGLPVLRYVGLQAILFINFWRNSKVCKQLLPCS